MLPVHPIIGSSLEFVGSLQGKKWQAFLKQISILWIIIKSTDVFKNIMKYEKMYSPEPFGFWFGPVFVVVLSKPEDLQVIISKHYCSLKFKLFLCIIQVL